MDDRPSPGPSSRVVLQRPALTEGILGLSTRGGWIAHAGFAPPKDGRTPSRASLLAAVTSGAHTVELDICVTRDGHLVLRHDVRVTRRFAVSDLTLDELRLAVPHTLELDDAVSLVADRTALMLDVKDGASAPLGAWLERNRGRGRFSVCANSIESLAVLRAAVPEVPRWLSLPNLPARLPRTVVAVARALAGERDPRRLLPLIADLSRGLAEAYHVPWHKPFRGVVWRPYADGLRRLVESVDASGICVHHWLVTPELVRAVRDLGLPFAVWVVNREPDAQRVMGYGATLLTSDRPEQLTAALRLAPRAAAVPRLRRPRTLRAPAVSARAEAVLRPRAMEPRTID